MGALIEGRHDTEVERFELAGVDGAAIGVIHARPLGPPIAGIVVHPDIMGLRPLFDDLCRRLATHGYAVVAPEPFARLLAAGVPDLDTSAGRMAAVRDLDDELQVGDLERAADVLVVADDVSRVVVLGFCMGGMQALKAAATGRFDGAVAFYGMVRLPEGWQGARIRPALDTAVDACPTLAIFGSADPLVPLADIDALRAAWAAKPECEVVVYDGADHGFVHDPDRPAHRADDARDAWARVLAFLERVAKATT